ncbi:succinate--CoA ligase [Chromatiales bacterium (ex Bugula neritina AB1)]|nr:succinate--CoA ligase [Chromatiales bacterium (ex Bugula neritina AB1)]
MNFEEYAAKPLLAKVGIAIPNGQMANSIEQATTAGETLGKVVVKAQVPTGKRGKAGGIKTADNAQETAAAAEAILGMTIGEFDVEKVLIEQRAPIKQEYYAAILNDADSKGPLLMFSDQGGMDIEDIARTQPEKLVQHCIDVRDGLNPEDAEKLVSSLVTPDIAASLGTLLAKLYQAYADNDAELMEINPLALLDDNSLMALDCKFVLDDSAIKRQQELAETGTPEKLTGRELSAQDLDLKYIDLDGSIGLLANGAGLTMTTMDVITHYEGSPANFLEIGGEAYTKATEALKLMLGNEKIKSLVVNFCGAFARTDVMTEGVINAWEELKPEIPVFFSIHGTGSDEARSMLHERLGMTSFETMDEAIQAAISAARSTSGGTN